MKKLVLVDPDEHRSQLIGCRMRNGPKNSLFLLLECDDSGTVLDNKENEKAIQEAFMKEQTGNE